MIYSRLQLARYLLTDDGVIFVSIDDNEQENIKKYVMKYLVQLTLLHKLYGKKFIQEKFSYQFSSSHEYVLCYAKKKRFNSNDKEGFKRNLLPRDNTDAYSNPDNDPKGPWKQTL